MKISKSLVLLVLGCLVSCGGADSPLTVTTDETENKDNGQTVNSAEQLLSDVQATAIDTDQNIGVDAGYISDGTAITVPTGFTIDRCVMTAAPATISGSAISTRATVNSTTGRVTCKKVVQERVEVPAEEQGCVAAYTIICVKSDFTVRQANVLP